MSTNDLITKITHTYSREDGSEVRIVAQACHGAGLNQSIDIYVLRRESADHDWSLCSDQPHPDWRKMSVDDYLLNGRSDMLNVASHAEILKAASMIGRPLDDESLGFHP